MGINNIIIVLDLNETLIKTGERLDKEKINLLKV